MTLLSCTRQDERNVPTLGITMEKSRNFPSPADNGLSVLPFIVSALVIVITASATATFHSAKAALANPAENLRTE